jgi:type II secretory pathway component PulF
MEQRSELERVDDARVFHHQLRRLIDAKIPICLDPRGGVSSVRSMEMIHAQFESHLKGQGTIESYLSDSGLPTAYRMALEEWLGGSPSEALDRLTVGAEGQRFLKKAVGFVFLQASLILGFLFLGMVCTCVWLLPKMERLQSDSFVEPGQGLKMLSRLRDSLPYWGPMVGAVACIAFLFHRSLFRLVMARTAPMRDDSYALSEFQGLFSRPVRFQWLVSWVVIVCGVCVLLQALSVFGVTIELLTQLVTT